MGMPLKVLLVEDSEDDALLLVRRLRRGGYDPTWERVDTSADMEAALDGRNWDLIISDHSMPAFSSLAALGLLRRKGFVDLPFIIVSGRIGEDAAVAAMKAGAHDYLMKDNLARLNSAIERELRDAEVRRERHRRNLPDDGRRTVSDGEPSDGQDVGLRVSRGAAWGHLQHQGPALHRTGPQGGVLPTRAARWLCEWIRGTAAP